ncbi:MAG: alpha/beta fold hydrolase [Candidatus Obscuribacter sp.]|nr:alpha/beta fold hydrolase [Candidatus Obscuribacter sp.]
MIDSKFCQRVVALFVLAMTLTPSALAAPPGFKERLKERIQKRLEGDNQIIGSSELAGLKVSYWLPAQCPSGQSPLIIFSHGFGGKSTQSKALAYALSQAGYLVVAPDHGDARSAIQGKEQNRGPEVPFKDAPSWSDKTYMDRGKDIAALINALQQNPRWSCRIDWDKVALAGHSLGGYTVLGLAGAWSQWPAPKIKAVLALSPYCAPYLIDNRLAGIKVPVMYQGGNRDFTITPQLEGPIGAFSKTPAPAYLVEFDQVGHLGWTNFNQKQEQSDLINHYAIVFLIAMSKDLKKQSPANNYRASTTYKLNRSVSKQFHSRELLHHIGFVADARF